ncbi:hypothetical protein F2Q69_00014472 [Brassica cretica]|uniref:Uncharacterized protein n=1 Tax=Brassica cretica TaxID=69181 RepID=A0A8S9QSX3_BRACR|nr:hypothetical protein F2Q69_00014472 [Brassica cretica]
MVDLGFDLEQIWVRSLSECPPEWCSVAAFTVRVCSLLPLSSPVSSSGCFGKNFPHLFQVEKTI